MFKTKKVKSNISTSKDKTNTILEIPCRGCDNIIKIDTTKVQKNIKFDYKCAKCGAFRLIMIKDENETNNK